MSGTVLIGQGHEITEIPQKDWERGLSEVQQHIKGRLSFMSEEHAREFRAETDQIEGAFYNLQQGAHFTKIVQSAIFAFE